MQACEAHLAFIAAAIMLSMPVFDPLLDAVFVGLILFLEPRTYGTKASEPDAASERVRSGGMAR